jgi:D-alanyl-D-alanine carboxypeptidase
MRRMFTTSTSKTRIHRLGRAAVALAAAGLIITAGACSSDDDDASPASAVPATTAVPPTTAAPTTTVAATTTAPPATTEAPRTTVAPSTTAAGPTTTQPNPARQALLAGVLESHHAAGEFVGARIAVLDADGSITEATVGTQTTDAGSPPVDLDVPWNIGSATKMMVAVVVLQLADEGKIDLDAGIAPYMPDLADADRITPRQLLQHTSGLNNYDEQPAVLSEMQRPWTRAELIAVSEAAGRLGEPGGPFHYSNTNYMVLAEIIEQATGNSWSDEVQERIARPLGMTHTSLLEHMTSPGFAVVDGGFVDATTMQDPSLGGPAGGLQSTGRDMLRFGEALFDGTLLSPESQKAMQAFVPGEDYSAYGLTHGYGLGLERYVSEAGAALGHLGTGLHTSFLGYDAGTDTLVVVTSNTINSESTAIMALETLAAIAALSPAPTA